MVGQRLDRPRVRFRGVGFGIAQAVAIGRRRLAALVRHERADDAEQTLGCRMLEGEARALLLGFFAQIALQRAFEKGRPLRHARDFVVEDQGGRPVDPLHLLHRIVALVGRPARAPVTFPARGRAAPAPPVAQAAPVPGRGGERPVGRQGVVRRDDGEREGGIEIGVDEFPVRADGEAGHHGEPPGVGPPVPGHVGAGGEAHRPDVARHADRDLGGPHVRHLAHCGRNPAMRRVVRLGRPAVFDQQHDGVAVGQRFRALQPGVRRHFADADHGGVHEIGHALRIAGAGFEIVGDRRAGGRRVLLGRGREDVPVFQRRRRHRAVAGGVMQARAARPVPFHGQDRVVPGQCLQRIGAEREVAVPGAGVKKHGETPWSPAVLAARRGPVMRCRMH